MSNSQGLERRRNSRINIKQKIVCKSHADFRALYITNISKGGVFIKTSYPPPIGTLMLLGLHLPGTEREIEFTGKVVQATPLGAGVQLTNMASADMQLMESFLQSQTNQSDKPFSLQGTLTHSCDDTNIFISGNYNLQCASLPVLLRYFKEKTLTGTLRIFNGNTSEFRNIHLHSGMPIEITSSKFNENYCLGRLLKHSGSITNDELQSSLLEMSQTNKKQGSILLEHGMLSWEEIQRALEWQLEIKLDEILCWPKGTYSFVSEEFPSSEENWIEPELDIEVAIFKSLYRQAQHNPDVVIQLFCNYEEFEVMPCEIKRRGKNNRPLFSSSREIEIWHHLVHHNYSIRQLCTEIGGKTEIDELFCKAFVFGLMNAGLVSLRHPNWNKQLSNQDKLTALIQSPNYFQRLQLPWTVSDKSTITNAHQRMIDWISHPNADEATEVDLQTTLKEKLNEAYETLSNDFKRRSYRKSFVQRQDMQNIANRLYRLGKIKLSKGKVHAAYPLLQNAADLNPGSPEYEQWLEKAKKASRGAV